MEVHVERKHRAHHRSRMRPTLAREHLRDHPQRQQGSRIQPHGRACSSSALVSRIGGTRRARTRACSPLRSYRMWGRIITRRASDGTICWCRRSSEHDVKVRTVTGRGYDERVVPTPNGKAVTLGESVKAVVDACIARHHELEVSC